jgi:hypothetical protein
VGSEFACPEIVAVVCVTRRALAKERRSAGVDGEGLPAGSLASNANHINELQITMAHSAGERAVTILSR